MPKIIPVPGMPTLHTTPLAVVWKDGEGCTVELDDDTEKRFRLAFYPFQAVKVITFDCYELPKGTSMIANTIMEVVDSHWIDELKEILSRVDKRADFMDKARHFLLPLQDEFLEVVAWDIHLLERPGGSQYTPVW